MKRFISMAIELAKIVAFCFGMTLRLLYEAGHWLGSWLRLWEHHGPLWNKPKSNGDRRENG